MPEDSQSMAETCTSPPHPHGATGPSGSGSLVIEASR